MKNIKKSLESSRLPLEIMRNGFVCVVRTYGFLEKKIYQNYTFYKLSKLRNCRSVVLADRSFGCRLGQAEMGAPLYVLYCFFEAAKTKEVQFEGPHLF